MEEILRAIGSLLVKHSRLKSNLAQQKVGLNGLLLIVEQFGKSSRPPPPTKDIITDLVKQRQNKKLNKNPLFTWLHERQTIEISLAPLQPWGFPFNSNSSPETQPSPVKTYKFLKITLPHQSTVSACTHSFGFVCNSNLKFCSDLSAEHIRFWHSPYAKTYNLANNLTYPTNHPPALFARTHADAHHPKNWEFWVTWVPNSNILAPPNLKSYNPSKQKFSLPHQPIISLLAHSHLSGAPKIAVLSDFACRT